MSTEWRAQEQLREKYVLSKCITTVFVDTRLWKTKTLAETFPKFPSVLLVIDMSDRNPPIKAR